MREGGAGTVLTGQRGSGMNGSRAVRVLHRTAVSPWLKQAGQSSEDPSNCRLASLQKPVNLTPSQFYSHSDYSRDKPHMTVDIRISLALFLTTDSNNNFHTGLQEQLVKAPQNCLVEPRYLLIIHQLF